MTTWAALTTQLEVAREALEQMVSTSNELSEDAIRIAEAYGVRLIDELEKFR